MLKQNEPKQIKIKIIVFLFLLSFNYELLLQKDINYFTCKKIIKLNETNELEIKHFHELFKNVIKNDTILIFEPNPYHHECTPGYSKYFIELGYNVDILINLLGVDSLSLFKELEKIRVFTFFNLSEIKMNSKNLSTIIKKYKYVLLQTTDKEKKDLILYNNLELLKLNSSIFVFHDIRYIDFGYKIYLDQNRVWTLGNFEKGLRINPHYFGDIKLKNKNNKTKFFMTSTANRNYKYLIDCLKKLKEENVNFEIIITGRSNELNQKKIPKNLVDNFSFRIGSSYLELYQIVENSDYIIIPIDLTGKYDFEFKKFKVSGNIQLVYGFLKPAIIHEEFTNFYNLDKMNSLIYNNYTLYNILKKAIFLSQKEYKIIQNNLNSVVKQIYDTSLNNIKKVIKSSIG